MATKNLARTVVEGGQSRSSGIDRREATRAERHVTNAVLRRACVDLDGFLGTPLPQRKRMYREFADKLAPARRWLMSQVGRNWNRVRSDLTRRYDRRTTKARHLLDDHLLSDVEPLKYVPKYPDFLIAPDGTITRGEPRTRYGSYGRDRVRQTITADELRVWLASRRIGRRGRHLYWYVPTDALAFRQDRELSTNDVAFFHKITMYQRDIAMIPKEE